MPLARGGQADCGSPGLPAVLLTPSPHWKPSTLFEKVAVTAKADPSVATGGVGTLDLVLTSGTFLAKVAAEVTLKAWPVWH